MTAGDVSPSADKMPIRDASQTGNARHRWILISQMQSLFGGGGGGTGSAETLTGVFLAPNVLSSSLTSVGVLEELTVTATINGSVSGNAGTATAFQTARTINGVAFDGTGNITITAGAGTLTGTVLAANIVGSSLTSVGILSNLTVTNIISGSINGNAATVTTNANLTGDITSTGNVTAISAGVITNSNINASAAIDLSKLSVNPLDRDNHTGTQSADTITDGTSNKVYTAAEKTKLAAQSGTNTGDQTTISGNAGTATALQNARAINGVVFDGTGDIVAPASVVSAGTFAGRRLVGLGNALTVLTTGFLSDGIMTQQTTKKPYRTIGRAHDLIVVFSNVTNSQTTTPVANVDNMLITASIEYPALTFTQLTFNGGDTSITLKPNSKVISDSPLLEIPPNTNYWVRTCVTVTSGQKWFNNFGFGGGTDGAIALNTDATMSGTISGTSGYGFAPLAVMGATEAIAQEVILLGDSIAEGFGDSGGAAGTGGLSPNGDYFWGVGIFGRSFGATFPKFNMHKSSEFLHNWAGPGQRARYSYLFSCARKFCCQLGCNDFRLGDSQATMQANYISLWDALLASGARGYQTTITPVSTGTYTTVGGQTTVAANSVRVIINNWIRDGAPINGITRVAVATGDVSATTVRAGHFRHPLLGYFEVADTVENARDSGIWKASYTGDGIHPNLTGYAAGRLGIDVSKFYQN